MSAPDIHSFSVSGIERTRARRRIMNLFLVLAVAAIPLAIGPRSVAESSPGSFSGLFSSSFTKTRGLSAGLNVPYFGSLRQFRPSSIFFISPSLPLYSNFSIPVILPFGSSLYRTHSGYGIQSGYAQHSGNTASYFVNEPGTLEIMRGASMRAAHRRRTARHNASVIRLRGYYGLSRNPQQWNNTAMATIQPATGRDLVEKSVKGLLLGKNDMRNLSSLGLSLSYFLHRTWVSLDFDQKRESYQSLLKKESEAVRASFTLAYGLGSGNRKGHSFARYPLVLSMGLSSRYDADRLLDTPESQRLESGEFYFSPGFSIMRDSYSLWAKIELPINDRMRLRNAIERIPQERRGNIGMRYYIQ